MLRLSGKYESEDGKMDFDDGYAANADSTKNIPPQYPQRQSLPFLTPENTIAIYTTLSILLKMRTHLGLEAMMEYMEFYISTIERYNPRFKGAVEQALSLMNVQKIYNSMCPARDLDKTPGPLEEPI